MVRDSPQLGTWIKSPLDVGKIFGQRQPAVGRLLSGIDNVDIKIIKKTDFIASRGRTQAHREIAQG